MANRRLLFLFLAGLVLLPCPGHADQTMQDSVRRFALVVGANNGGKDRAQLRYAVSDARSLLDILLKIGGVFPMDSMLVTDPTRDGFLGSLEEFKQKIIQAKNASRKIEMIFYFSGHSDEEAVLLGKDKVSYREIRRTLESIPADVRIAILDSCSSGAFTRVKGGKLASPFLENNAYDMKGYAIMTSSSADESSQESDRLKSSFFTHYLETGLRGAADMDHDGQITLNEAYQYAYNETLSKTEKTLSGPQHPNYDIQMSGTGDVLMTDVRKSSALLVFDASLQGRIFIHDKDDRLVLELHKSADHEMELGLEAGDFTVTNERDGKVFETVVHLPLGKQVTLTAGQFQEGKQERTRKRGRDPREPRLRLAQWHEKWADPGYRVVRWALALYPDPGENLQTIHYYYFDLFGSWTSKLDGVDVGIGPGIVTENGRGMEFSVTGNYNGGEFEGAQVSFFANYSGGNTRGVQVSSCLNLCLGDMDGVQTSSFFNYLDGSLAGTQYAGFVNYAAKIEKGVQVSVLNYNQTDMHGAQLGVVNLCGDSTGLQCGLVNIAKEQEGASVGLVNIASNGENGPVVWWDNLSSVNVGYKFRVNHLYSIFAVSKGSDDQLPTAFSYYLGGHFPVANFALETDLGWVHSEPDFNATDIAQRDSMQARVMLRWQKRFFSVFMGGGGAYAFEDLENDNRDYLRTNNRFQPLYLGGVQLSF